MAISVGLQKSKLPVEIFWRQLSSGQQEKRVVDFGDGGGDSSKYVDIFGNSGGFLLFEVVDSPKILRNSDSFSSLKKIVAAEVH